MEGMHLACARVQYRAAVNSELVDTVDCTEDGRFLDTSIAQS